MSPRRIQRKRTPGARHDGAVIVDRSSRYGNPFVIVNGLVVEHPGSGKVWSCGSPAAARKCASDQYEAWLDGEGPDAYRIGTRIYDRRRIHAALEIGVLTGRDLACTCPLPDPGQPDHCHGVRLLARANPGGGL